MPVCRRACYASCFDIWSGLLSFRCDRAAVVYTQNPGQHQAGTKKHASDASGVHIAMCRAACAQANPRATLSRATRSSRWEHVACQQPASRPQSAVDGEGVPKTLWVASDQLAHVVLALRR